MAEAKEIVLTQEGKQELEAELDQLKNVTRKEVSEKIKEARSFGDLSENAEYDAAKDEQAEVEARINQIEYMLKYAKIVEDEGLDVVTVGKKVTLDIFGQVDVEYKERFSQLEKSFPDYISYGGAIEANKSVETLKGSDYFEPHGTAK